MFCHDPHAVAGGFAVPFSHIAPQPPSRSSPFHLRRRRIGAAERRASVSRASVSTRRPRHSRLAAILEQPLRSVMECHEMSWGGESFTVISTSFQAKGGTGCPCLARVSRGRACAGAGGRIAAARFARLIARARRRTHLARRFPPRLFSAPSRSLSAETPKGGPGSRLSLLSFYTISPNVKPV